MLKKNLDALGFLFERNTIMFYSRTACYKDVGEPFKPLRYTPTLCILRAATTKAESILHQNVVAYHLLEQRVQGVFKTVPLSFDRSRNSARKKNSSVLEQSILTLTFVTLYFIFTRLRNIYSLYRTIFLN